MNWATLEKVQPIASKILTNSVKKDRIAHAYLIQGLRGTGKVEIATLLTQTIKNYYRSRGFFHAIVTHSEKNAFQDSRLHGYTH